MGALCAFLLVALPVQTPGDPGPHAVGWRDVSFSAPEAWSNSVKGIVYYPATAEGPDQPADVTSGPYPLTSFVHGYFATAGFHSEICKHIASWGFTVAAMDTFTGIWPYVYQGAADDALALAHWIEDKSNTPGHWAFGLVSDADWSCFTHSMGGPASFLMADAEPRITALAPCQPWWASGTIKGYEHSVLVVAGSEDLVAPPVLHAEPLYANLGTAARRAWALVLGAGHQGTLDFPATLSSLDFAEQQRLHRHLVGAFLRAEIKGEENLWRDVLGEGLEGEPVERESDGPDPVLWAATSAVQSSAAVLGLATMPADTALLLVSAAPADLPTPWGVLGADPSLGIILGPTIQGAPGFTEVWAPLPPGLSGLTLWIQGFALGTDHASLSRTAAYILP